MGWRGALRSIAAAQRRNERTVEKRRRELLANQKQFNKLTEQALAAYEIGDKLKEIVQGLITRLDCWCEAIETDKDHVHILLRTKPKYNISDIVNKLKGHSAYLLFREYPKLRQQLRRGHLWSPSYFVSTVGIDKQTVTDYINSQREHGE